LSQVQSLKIQLDKIVSGNNLDTWNFYSQIKSLNKQFGDNDQLNYILNELWNYLNNKFTIEKNKAKAISKDFKNNFIAQYISWITLQNNLPDTCTGRYNTLDNISFANNFPTALTVATWYRESNCWFYLPKNWDWPFQILSKDYGSWNITEEIFTKSVQDFIDFSKAKHANYKSKLNINLTYTWFDFTGIINHWALYNWCSISWNITIPNNPKYIYDWYGDEYSWAVRDGIVSKFLKTLKREIDNN
jgi:hypothetical protein